MYWTGILAKRAETKESKRRLVEWAQQDRLCWDTGSNRGVTRKMLGRLEKGDWGGYTMQLRRGKEGPGKIGGGGVINSSRSSEGGGGRERKKTTGR